jgi:hypothetical protein
MANSMLRAAKLTLKLCGQRPPSSAPQQRRASSEEAELEEGEAEVAADNADEGGADAAVIDALEEGVDAFDGAAASKRTVAEQVGDVGGSNPSTTTTAAAPA